MSNFWKDTRSGPPQKDKDATPGHHWIRLGMIQKQLGPWATVKHALAKHIEDNPHLHPDNITPEHNEALLAGMDMRRFLNKQEGILENLPANSVGGGGVNLDKARPLGTVARSMGLGTQHKARASRDSQEQKKHAVRMSLAKRMKDRREKNRDGP